MAKKSKFTTPTPPTKPVVSSSTLPRKAPAKPWHTHVTIDLFAKVASYTILHPWPAWMLPLCLRAQVYTYDSPAMMISIAWAIFLTAMWLLGVVDRRIAYGLPREVSLAEETIVITGGASGLGLLIAEVYGMRGANVAVLDVKQLDGDKRGVRFYQCDVGDRAAVEAGIARIREELGPPTILVNNAGIVNGKSMLELSAAEVEKNFRVNLLSHFHTIQTVLPIMLEEDCGTIVTVSSVLGQLGAAKLADYTAAKAGLIAMHASLRAELAQSKHESADQIRTILCTPGQMSTTMFNGVKTPSNFIGPVVEPVDVAKEIIRMIDAGESGDIAVPLYARYIDWLDVLPVGVKTIVRSLSGVDRAMTGFHGSKTKSTAA